MAIAYFGSASAQYSGTATPVIPTPSSIPAGALIVVSLGGFFGTTTLSLSGSGWTQLDGGMSSTGSHWIFAKVATGGEGSITATGDGSGCFGAGATTVFTGVNTTTPVIAHSGTRWGGVSHATVTSPSVNNTGTSSACAVFVGNFYNGGAGHGQATPTNMSLAVVSGDDTTTGSSFSFYRLNAPTGSQSYSTAATDGHINWYGGDGLLFLAPGTTAVNASAGVAMTTATALAAPMAHPAPGKAAATAATLAPSITDTASPQPGRAQATAASLAPVVAIGVPAGSSVATSAALVPTIADTVDAPIGAAAVTADAYAPTVTFAAETVADVALAMADAYGANVFVESNVSAGVAEAAGSALDPTSSNTNAFAGVAHVFAIANITIQPGTAHAIPAVVRMAANNPDTIIYVDGIVTTVDAYSADAQVAIEATAGLAQATISIGDATGEPVSTSVTDAIDAGVVVNQVSIASSSNPPTPKSAVVATAYNPTARVGVGLSATAAAFVGVRSPDVVISGGSSAEVRVLQVRLTAERIYSIPHEAREIKVKRT